MVSEGSFLQAAVYSSSVRQRYPSFSVMKSDTIIPEPRLRTDNLGFRHSPLQTLIITGVKRGLVMEDENVLVLPLYRWWLKTSGKAERASSLGADSRERKPPETIWRRNC